MEVICGLFGTLSEEFSQTMLGKLVALLRPNPFEHLDVTTLNGCSVIEKLYFPSDLLLTAPVRCDPRAPPPILSSLKFSVKDQQRIMLICCPVSLYV